MITFACGIASLVFSVLGLLIPFFGIFSSGISGFLAWLSVGRGTALGAAAVIINFINLFLFSPGYTAIMIIEASHRTLNQSQSFMIWEIVLFIQIAAIGVFIVNFAIDKLDFKTHFKERRKKKQYSSNSNKIESSICRENNQQPPENRHEKSASPLSRTIIYKLHGTKQPDSKFWKSEFDGIENNAEKIVSDGADLPTISLAWKRIGIAFFSILALCIVFIIPAVILQPNWFPFFKSSTENIPIPKNIQPHPPSEKNKWEITKVNPPSTDHTYTDSQIKNTSKQLLERKTRQSNSSYSKTPNSMAKHEWYIVKLNNGVEILAQSIDTSNGAITILSKSGVIETLKREDVLSVKKVQL
jgi:hypothetical protein